MDRDANPLLKVLMTLTLNIFIFTQLILHLIGTISSQQDNGHHGFFINRYGRSGIGSQFHRNEITPDQTKKDQFLSSGNKRPGGDDVFFVGARYGKRDGLVGLTSDEMRGRGDTGVLEVVGGDLHLNKEDTCVKHAFLCRLVGLSHQYVKDWKSSPSDASRELVYHYQ